MLKELFYRKKECKQEFDGDMKIYYKNLFIDLQEAIKFKKIDFYSAKGWFCHLPLRYTPYNNYTEEVNLIIDKCIKILYKYCIKRNIINNHITFKEFYEGRGLCDKEYPKSLFYKKYPSPLRLID